MTNKRKEYMVFLKTEKMTTQWDGPWATREGAENYIKSRPASKDLIIKERTVTYGEWKEVAK